jgi:hypothetical protein
LKHCRQPIMGRLLQIVSWSCGPNPSACFETKLNKGIEES